MRMQLGGFSRYSSFNDTLSSAEYDAVEQRLAERDLNIKPRAYRPKNSSAWDSLTTEDWRLIGKALSDALKS